MSKNKINRILYITAGMLFIVAALIGKNIVFVPIGLCFAILGMVKKNEPPTAENAMTNTKKMKSYFGMLFYIGLCLAIFVAFDLRYSLLPDFYSGLLAGISASLILGAGTLKHIIKDD